MSSSFYITLSESQERFSGSLRAEFSKVFRLRGEWEMAVISLAATNPDNLAWIFCNVADYSFINSDTFQIVDILDTSSNNKIHKNIKPLYVKVLKKTFLSINVEIKERIDQLNEFPFKSSSDVTCILHFRKA